MTDVADPEIEEVKKTSKLPMILGVVLALLGGGGGFYAVSSGLLLGGGESVVHDKADGAYDANSEQAHDESTDQSSADVASFVPIDPLVVSLPSASGTRFLRFTAQLEVPPKYASTVTALLPRVVDVLNGYLRAVDLEELSDPDALMRLRAQMLRRVQVVTGQSQVRDLLIMEFVLN